MLLKPPPNHPATTPQSRAEIKLQLSVPNVPAIALTQFAIAPQIVPPSPDIPVSPAGPATGTEHDSGPAVPATPDVPPDKINAYLQRVHDRIQRSLIYPSALYRYRLAGQVYVRFVILADGKIDAASIRIDRGEKTGPLQDAALETLREIDRFEPPPLSPMMVEVPVNYQTQP